MLTQPNKRVFFEVLAILVATTLLSFLIPAMKGAFEILVVLYFLLERWLRKRSWAEIGFKPTSFFKDLLTNWALVVLVGVGTQLIPFFVASTMLPDYFSHIQSRLPLDIGGSWGILIVSLLVGTLAEEMVFRALFQERLSWRLGTPLAVVLVALLFAGMHWAPGSGLVVFVDLVFIALDGLIYGAIFARSKNIYVCWLAHFLADMVGIALLIAWLR